MINLEIVEDENINIDLYDNNEINLVGVGEAINLGGTNNYNELINKPFFNGVEIVGNIPKPTYVADEIINDSDAISIEYIASLFN